MTKVGEKLRKIRESKKLGIKKVAPMVDVTYSYLSKIENGHRTPNPEIVSKLCEVYGKDKEEVMALLGKLPDDIQQMIEDRGTEVFEFLRENFKEEK